MFEKLQIRLYWIAYRFVSVCFFFGSLFSFGQAPNLVAPSPNAASLGKYGEIPVSTYTGIPSIDLPLFTAQSGPLTVPVSLSYHASGIKVEDIASNVGIGWSLNAGGVITRSMRGLPDESGPGYFNSFPDDYTSLTEQDKLNASKGLKDLEPDLFFVNLGKYSGKILFDNQGGCHLQPVSKFKIKPGIGPNKGSNANWEITTEDGTKYIFSATEQTSTQSICSNDGPSGHSIGMDFPNPWTRSYVSSWYLTSIESANQRESITFEYQIQNIAYDQKLSHTRTNNSVEGTFNSYCGSTVTVSSQLLRRINFSQGSIQLSTYQTGEGPFPYLPSIRADLPGASIIHEIQLKNTNNEIINRFAMAYDYFNSGCDEPECKRLKLVSVTEWGSAAVPKPPYRFEYNPEPLPRRDSFDQDHWGYYNKKSNTVMIPQRIVYTPPPDNTAILYAGADKTPDPNASQAGILKKIFYPTGGFTKFDYELNQVVDPTTDPTSVLSLPNKTSPTPAKYSISGDGSAPNSSISFTVNGYYRQGQFVKARYRITGCTPVGDPDQGTPIGGPSVPLNCAYMEIRTSTGNPVSTFVYLDEQEKTISFYLPNGNYTLKGANAKPSQSYYCELTIESEENSQNKYAGGLRVARITSSDGINPLKDQIKEYIYTDPTGQSTGRLSNYPLYVYQTYKDVKKINQGLQECYYDVPVLNMTSGSNTTLGTDRGSFVGYGLVTEYHGTLGEFGRSDYYYRSIYESASYSDLTNNTFPFASPVTDNEWKRGNLIQQVDYKTVTGSSDRFVKVRETINEYTQIGYPKLIDGLKIGIYRDKSAECDYQTSGLTQKSLFTFSGDVAYVLSQKTEKVYDQTTANLIQTHSTYSYSPTHYQIVQTETSVSTPATIPATESQKIITRSKYPADYQLDTAPANPMAQAIQNMTETWNIHNQVIEQQVWKRENGVDKLLSAEIKLFDSNGLDLLKALKLKTKSTLTAQQYSESTITGGSFTLDQDQFYTALELSAYNSKGLPQEAIALQGPRKAFIWNTTSDALMAQAINANANQIAYTSFEKDPGNWQYSTTTTPGRTGDNSFQGTVSTANQIPAGKYVIGFWAKGTGTVTVEAQSVAVSSEWSYHETVLILPASKTISISTNSALIDELRLFPSTSQMSTQLNKELTGVQAYAGAEGRNSFYSYDWHNRLSTIHNQDKDIVKHFQYNIAPAGNETIREENSLRADFTYSGNLLTAQTLSFTAQETKSGTEYIWDFGDGTQQTANSRTTTHIYLNPGSFIVKLLVRNGLDYKRSANLLVIASPEPPGWLAPALTVSNFNLIFRNGAYRLTATLSTNPQAGTPPYTEYQWKVNGFTAPSITISYSSSTTTPATAIDVVSTTASRPTIPNGITLYFKCRVKDSEGKFSEWATVVIQTDMAGNPIE